MKKASSKQPIYTHVAFLRGINVGGHSIVSMNDLRNAFEKCGLTNVRTMLNSGNVLFSTPKGTARTLERLLENCLEKIMKKKINVIVRTKKDIEKLVAAEPFAGIRVTKETRLYITFLQQKPKRALHIPYTSDDGFFRILALKKGEIYSTLTLSPQKKTTDAMTILEKEFGKQVTTRNWNTIIRVHKAMTG